MTETSTAARQPVLYLSHGAPPLADDPVWTRQLSDWSATVRQAGQHPHGLGPLGGGPPRAQLHLGPHPAGLRLLGLPPEVLRGDVCRPGRAGARRRASPGWCSPGDTPVHRDEPRGLDHGAYVPLVEMYPEADVPVLQMSMPTLDPQRLFQLGRRLAPLRDEGTLIVGSGFTTHNLRWFNPSAGPDGPVPQASSEFDHWAAEALERQRRRRHPGLHAQGAGGPGGPPAHRALGAPVRGARRGLRVGLARQRERRSTGSGSGSASVPGSSPEQPPSRRHPSRRPGGWRYGPVGAHHG